MKVIFLPKEKVMLNSTEGKKYSPFIQNIFGNHSGLKALVPIKCYDEHFLLIYVVTRFNPH